MNSKVLTVDEILAIFQNDEKAVETFIQKEKANVVTRNENGKALTTVFIQLCFHYGGQKYQPIIQLNDQVIASKANVRVDGAKKKVSFLFRTLDLEDLQDGEYAFPQAKYDEILKQDATKAAEFKSKFDTRLNTFKNNNEKLMTVFQWLDTAYQMYHRREYARQTCYPMYVKTINKVEKDGSSTENVLKQPYVRAGLNIVRENTKSNLAQKQYLGRIGYWYTDHFAPAIFDARASATDESKLVEAFAKGPNGENQFLTTANIASWLSRKSLITSGRIKLSASSANNTLYPHWECTRATVRRAVKVGNSDKMDAEEVKQTQEDRDLFDDDDVDYLANTAIAPEVKSVERKDDNKNVDFSEASPEQQQLLQSMQAPMASSSPQQFQQQFQQQQPQQFQQQQPQQFQPQQPQQFQPQQPQQFQAPQFQPQQISPDQLTAQLKALTAGQKNE